MATEKIKPVSGPPTALELRYAAVVDGAVGVIEINVARLAALDKLSAQEASVLALLSQALQSLHKGPVRDARTIRIRETRAGRAE